MPRVEPGQRPLDGEDEERQRHERLREHDAVRGEGGHAAGLDEQRAEQPAPPERQQQRDAAHHRFAGLPAWLQVLGALLFVGGYAMTAWTFSANSFASPAVRMQPERGHHVIDSGPYAHVRHPMYAGALLVFLGMPLLLCSPLGLLGLPIGAAVLALRTGWEEAALREGLPGYAEYAARVRHRFVPGLW